MCIRSLLALAFASLEQTPWAYFRFVTALSVILETRQANLRHMMGSQATAKHVWPWHCYLWSRD